MEQLDLTNEKKLGLPLSIPEVIEIAYKSMNGDLISLNDIASAYCDGELVKAIKLITHPVFNHMVHHLAIANAKLGFDAIAFKELINIARSGENSERINAIKTLGDMLGYNESKKAKQSNTNININLDAIVRQSESSPFKGF